MLRTAVITGASRGIGLAVAHRFLSEGFRVISVSRTEGELQGRKGFYRHDPEFICCDLSDKEATKEAAAQISRMTEHIDVLVNNAGVFIPGEICTEEDRIFELQMSLNLGAAYYMSKAIVPLMNGGENYIFNICSTASLQAYPSGGSYCISKHALLGLSRVLREELKSKGISVSAVLPGATFTDSWKGTEWPESRFMKPEVVADAIWFAWQNRAHSVMEEILLRPRLGDI